jgi:energy-coupling factor transporter ATP-binding protein EcfA2
MTAPMFELRNVSYRYAGASRPSIHGINLLLDPGEIVGLVGPNEGGKSTVCLVASGFAPASIGGDLMGEALLDGQTLAVKAPWELAGRTGLLLAEIATQRSGMTATVLEEVAFGPVNLGLEVDDTLERARWALAALGIEELGDRHPANVSGGQARLVAIASILAMRPRLLVLDEPVGELDTHARSRLVSVLRDVAANGTAIIVAEHDTAFLTALGARVQDIREGSFGPWATR